MEAWGRLLSSILDRDASGAASEPRTVQGQEGRMLVELELEQLAG
jgi:hypothetical protein